MSPARKKALLTLETIVCVAPAILLLLWGIPLVLGLYVASLDTEERFRHISKPDMLIGLITLAGACIGIAVLLHLAAKTVRAQKYRFGIGFWVALSFGLYAAYNLYLMAALPFTIGAVLPLLMLTIHFGHIQTRLNRTGE